MSGAPLDAGPGASLSDAQEARLQLAGYLSCALSVAGSLYVLAHFGCKPQRQDAVAQTQLPHRYRRRGPRARMDFTDKLVLVLALFDLVTVAARAVGRGVVHDRALCRAQAAVIQAANLASCSWVCCMAFNLYRWIAGGESDATRQRRFPLFLAVAVVPGAGFVVFHLLTNKYGDATFFCWLDEIRYMFLNFYLFYLLMIVFNFVLLALIHFNMKQRVARHDTVEADTSSMLIRRKLLLYIVVFIVHRTPMMIYRIFEAGGLESLNIGLAMQVIQDLNGFSNSIVIASGYAVKKRTTGMSDENEAVLCSSARVGTTLTQSGRKVSLEPKKIAIFASTFNMGEKDVNEHELREWIPLGQDVYVIGVQECMDLIDFQNKVQLFHGFQENEITFFPTFRRIRGQALLEPLDADVFQRNYSLVATHGGYRVPSYTDRVFYSSLAGMKDSLRCLSYDSCEAVTSSDHKPVSACFEIALLATSKTSSASLLAEDALWNANSTDANPMILRAEGTFAASRMKDVPGACELRLRIEFRSIHWIDAVDSALFDRAEHVQFGFLFPLPCEDVFAPQRKLHEVAEHLTFGGSDSTNTGGMGFASTITPTSNFHTLKWHEFVNGGLRYHTLAGPMGRKHVAVVLRSLSRGRSMSKTSSASRLLGGSCSPSPHTSATSIASTCSPTPHGSSVGSTTSFSSEIHFGHGTFCAEGMAKKREVCVPLTLGGRLLGRLQLRVSLQMRQKK
ncbi:Transmembrane protein [Phytophthora cinnamomi]|uniref:Transmembrane protein n=1 Tax=Phytophthora cinnamomi TaxID=4785 RepID=UPI00355A59A8|nr:Transmembrane protein [Phytophthora cinnamomi]